ncbi:MAG: type I restriction-modification system subunit M [Candidatus Cloacimonetes bacterium]|nr:type I restriction-modification system subunit M [Candidatus Cloacimonadota bacterium]
MPNDKFTKHSENRADLIWSIANKLVGLYKPYEYGKVILPFTVIKRFNDTLAPTRDAVLKAKEKYKNMQVINAFLTKASGYSFYNISSFTFEELLSDPDNIEHNLRSYINSFSENVRNIIFGKDKDNEGFNFDNEITKLSNGNALYIVVQEFCSQKADFSPDTISSTEMGYIFEHLIKKFSESYGEEAGAHFTARDIVYLMTDLLIAGDEEDLKDEAITKEVYDMAMGTSQMLGCLSERISDINPSAKINCYGQEFNPETFAIASSDMLIRGGDANNMRFGDTLDDDRFGDFTFDYIISNPPFGIDWKKQERKVRDEHKIGENGRFGAGLPKIDDGQMLFLLNGITKLKDKGRMAIIQNGSPLQSGDAGSGQSNIRKFIIENDWLETIIQMPNDMFYKTGIATYIWIISKNKEQHRIGKVQLINAKNMFVKRRKSLGNKKNDFNDECIENIVEVYTNFEDREYNIEGKYIGSKILYNDDFKYFKVVVQTPLFDDDGKMILDKKGKPTPDKDKKDTENIPANISYDEYLEKNVLPYNPHAYIDESKTKIGYEIPFTRLFYKYSPPRDINEIGENIKKLEKQETELLKELFKNE